MTDRYRRLGPLPLRLMLTMGLLYHGLPRLTAAGHENLARVLQELGLSSPGAIAWTIGGVEVVGALFLLLGFQVRVVVIPLIIQLVFMIAKVHWPQAGLPGIELHLVYLAMLIALWFLGPGRLSIDERRHRDTYTKPFLIRHEEVATRA